MASGSIASILSNAEDAVSSVSLVGNVYLRKRLTPTWDDVVRLFKKTNKLLFWEIYAGPTVSRFLNFSQDELTHTVNVWGFISMDAGGEREAQMEGLAESVRSALSDPDNWSAANSYIAQPAQIAERFRVRIAGRVLAYAVHIQAYPMEEVLRAA